MIARLEPDVTPAQAQAALHGRSSVRFRCQRRSRPAEHAPGDRAASCGPGALAVARPVHGGALLALMVLVTLVLLTTCTNVGNLLMVRNASRRTRTDRARGARRRPVAPHPPVPASKALLLAPSAAPSDSSRAMGCVDPVVDAAPGGDSGSLAVSKSTRACSALPPLRVAAQRAAVRPGARLACDRVRSHRAENQSGAPRRRSARRLGRVLVGCQVACRCCCWLARACSCRRCAISRARPRVQPRSAAAGVDRHALRAATDEGPGRRRLSPAARARRGDSRRPVGHGHSQSSDAAEPAADGMTQVPGVELAPSESWDGADVGPAFFETMGIPAAAGTHVHCRRLRRRTARRVRGQRGLRQALLPERRSGRAGRSASSASSETRGSTACASRRAR